MDYFAPKHLIIGTNKFDKNSEKTQIYTYDGNAVKLPTETINDHYAKVHISESLEVNYEQMAQGYIEMGKINQEEAQVSLLSGEEANNSQMKLYHN